jgi:glyoxylate/hydroxypyruvate reductase A
MNGSPRVVFCAPNAKPEPWIRGLAAHLPDAKLWAWTDGSSTPADYAVVWTPPDAFYPDQPKLKAIFNLGAGVDGLLRSPALPRDVPLIRLEDAGMAGLMAEYVLQAAIRYARELDRMDDDRRARRWVQRRTTDRADFPVGVMGAGALGRPVASTLASHGFPVSLWAREVRQVDGLRCYGGRDELDAFLAATRILVCLLPLTPDTENIVDAALLARLMPDAYLINVARGRHVVDDDLLAAIAGGGIAGATLDVFREEPLPASHPFWDEPRITITPHCSAMTQRSETLKQIASKILQLERGETISGVVDRARGY